MPQVPALSRVVQATFAPDGPLARAVPDFEPRNGQVRMAEAVATVFERGGVLLAEAGTGTGKTLAYLVPAILSRERVLVSTGTKNLQEQIFFKDIPALRDALGIPFTATYMKGRANYICLHKLDRLNEGVGPAVHDVFLPMIREWATRTETGDRAELEDLPEELPFWNDVAATAETCLGQDCERYHDCFVTKMRQRAAESDVVIVNHHLLCADAAVRQNAYGEVIPACHRAIVDEAHQLEDIATQYFGYAVSTWRVEELARDIERALAAIVRDDETARADLTKAIERLRDYARAFFTELTFAVRAANRAAASSRAEERVRVSAETLQSALEPAGDLTSALDILQGTLAELVRMNADATTRDDDDEGGGERLQPDERPQPDERTDLPGLVRRAGELRDDLRVLLRADDPEYVYFVELRGRGVFLRASPIDVSAIIRELLLEKM